MRGTPVGQRCGQARDEHLNRTTTPRQPPSYPLPAHPLSLPASLPASPASSRLLGLRVLLYSEHHGALVCEGGDQAADPAMRKLLLWLERNYYVS
jgi:hypothetical protein